VRKAVVAALVCLVACSGGGASPAGTSTASRSPTVIAETPASSGTVKNPPPGSETLAGGCGVTEIYQRGDLPDWATVNAPKLVPYVVAASGRAIGYLFSFPLRATPEGNKILWYVGTSRDGFALNATGHPISAAVPIATFTKAADSGPGEIYPSGVTVPSPGCWHFTLVWHGGDQQADVDLLFV
jgi:hypothetical protein